MGRRAMARCVLLAAVCVAACLPHPDAQAEERSMKTRPADRKRLHVWEKVEITLTASVDRGNPYTDVEVWVDLTGPGFKKRWFF